jgi:release factor glutamine methyltransferase
VNLGEVLTQTRESLREKGIEDAALEGEILLRHALGISRARLFSHFEQEMMSGQSEDLKRVLERRLKGEPTAYITGHREFYGLDFTVDNSVLIPRPESELLVDKAIEMVKNREISRIADIGTGSGAIAISLAVNLPEATVYATEISDRALKVAAKNCRKHGVTNRVVLLHGNMLEPLPGPVDLIIANLPYVQASDIPAQGPLSFEPLLALDGGKDGLDMIRTLSLHLDGKLRGEGCLLLEIGQGQAPLLTGFLRELFPSAVIESDSDLAGIKRVVSLYLTKSLGFC